MAHQKGCRCTYCIDSSLDLSTESFYERLNIDAFNEFILNSQEAGFTKEQSLFLWAEVMEKPIP
jgi:hypothetical protein